MASLLKYLSFKPFNSTKYIFHYSNNFYKKFYCNVYNHIELDFSTYFKEKNIQFPHETDMLKHYPKIIDYLLEKKLNDQAIKLCYDYLNANDSFYRPSKNVISNLMEKTGYLDIMYNQYIKHIPLVSTCFTTAMNICVKSFDIEKAWELFDECIRENLNAHSDHLNAINRILTHIDVDKEYLEKKLINSLEICFMKNNLRLAFLLCNKLMVNNYFYLREYFLKFCKKYLPYCNSNLLLAFRFLIKRAGKIENIQHFQLPKKFPIIYIDSIGNFEEMIQHLTSSSIIGIDSESYSLPTRNHVCLIQISSPTKCYIIDILALNKVIDQALLPIFHDPNVLKVGCDFSNDIKTIHSSYPFAECFKSIYPFHDVDQLFTSIHSYWPYPAVSLNNLSIYCKGQTLNKTLQRSNWAKKPLTQNQLEYASVDAFVLIDIYYKLIETLNNFKIPIPEPYTLFSE